MPVADLAHEAARRYVDAIPLPRLSRGLASWPPASARNCPLMLLRYRRRIRAEERNAHESRPDDPGAIGRVCG
jgi:hypothetical protein